LVDTAPAPRPTVKPWITAPAVRVETPVTPRVVDTVAAPVTVSAPVATARPAVRLATET